MLSLFHCIASLILGLIPAVCGVLGVVQLLNIWKGEKQKIKIGWLRKRFCRSGCRNSYTLDLYEAFSAGTWNFSLSVI